MLSLEEVKSSLISQNQSRISSLVHSVQFFLYIILYKDYIIVTYLFLLIYTPQLYKRVYRLRMVVGLYALKIASIKSAKSSQYCFYRLTFISLKYLYLRTLNLMQLLTLGIDIRLTSYLHFSWPLLTYFLRSAILYYIVQYVVGGRGLIVVRKGG